MSATTTVPWCFWWCPKCEAEGSGAFVVHRLAMVCTKCGAEDGDSEQFRKCMEVDRMRRVQQREDEEHRKREAVPPLTQSPPEWADVPSTLNRLSSASFDGSPFAVKP